VYKYESYLKEMLLHEGEFSLSQIGVFTLTKESFVTGADDTSSMQKIDFLYDKKAETSQSLISFIAEREKKNIQIVAMDVESYLNEIRQLINTGKELPLEGLGFLVLNKQAAYEFTQQTEAEKNEAEAKRKKNRKDVAKTSLFGETKKKQKSGTSILMVIFIFLLVAGAVWGIYFLIFRNSENNNASQNNNVVTTSDTSTKQTITSTVDSISKKPTDSVANKPALNKNDSVLYKFIFETTADSARANARVAKLKVYNDPAAFDIIHTDSGYLYRLYLLKRISPADTAAIKDSVQNYFQRNITIEKVIK
jgi:hypothetical protein